MRCAWDQLKAVLPQWVAEAADRRCRETLQELRLRLGKPPELVCSDGIIRLDRKADMEDIRFCVNTASRYSPWAAQTMAKGFLTASGGHRIGLCGEAVLRDGTMTGLRQIDSLCIRVARDFPGIGQEAAKLQGSILLIGPPGSGKTTLLRDLCREISEKETLAVVDERGELFPEGIDRGNRLDILTGCSKAQGVDTLLRTMGPECVAVDEVTAEADCEALLRAGWCGVRLLATAHASSVEDLRCRSIYRTLTEKQLFDHILVLSRDKTWREERLNQ